MERVVRQGVVERGERRGWVRNAPARFIPVSITNRRLIKASEVGRECMVGIVLGI